MKTIITITTLTIATLFSIDAIGERTSEQNKSPRSLNIELAHPNYEEVFVWSEGQDSQSSGYTSPTSLLTQSEMIGINITTTEDLVKYEPSIVIRRRFIGDSNGTLGIRGANMFQTARSMVFADGVPLHYFLESRWKGAPRWTMVSASEIAQVEVVYGPFSAEYSGNAMGGVVLIETSTPQEEELHVDGSFFTQQFDDYGFDDRLNGFKGFVSYGNKVENFSYYLSYNHLANDSQPQIFRDSSLVPTPNGTPTPTPLPVTGAIIENDSRSNRRFWYGDTGVVETKTDNYKIKLGYELDEWKALLNIVYEDRNSDTDSANSYLTDNSGRSIWSGLVIQDGEAFAVDHHRLNGSTLSRESLSLGLRVRGSIWDDVGIEANINQFKILKDEKRTSLRNSNDPEYTLDGSVADYHSSGWQTADLKFTFNDIFTNGLQLISGARHEDYELNLDLYDSSNYNNGSKDSFTSRFGGKTSLDAVFTQFNWDVSPLVDVAFGLRYERYTSSNGYFGNDDTRTPNYEVTDVPTESRSLTSPKFSMGFKPTDDWLIRYAFAKAYRFPIIEELFSQYQEFNSQSIPRPDLKPEDGTHHNLLLEKTLEDGYLRANIFHDSIKISIESQTYPDSSIRTFSPIDKVKTLGVEFIANQYNVLIDDLDIRFNLSYTDSEIIKNNLAPSTEGNQALRLPKWRSHLLANYQINDSWNIGGNIEYASNSYGRSDNLDNENNVYGAQDGYTRIGLNTHIDLNTQIRLSFGVDNLTNEITYVAHPWPGRTVYFNFSYDM